MSVPNTYLLTAPANMDDDPFGRGMSSDTLVRGLQDINPQIWVEPYFEGIWYPGKATGITCLWVGSHKDKRHSSKLTAFTPGVIPEFTQVDGTGLILSLGWRQIFEKVIKHGGAPRYAIENKFRLSLDISSDDGGYCEKCRSGGRKVPSEKDGRCGFHNTLREQVRQIKAMKADAEYVGKHIASGLI